MVTTVFVNNIPRRVHWTWLGRIFRRLGRVIDVFIPKKISNRGYRFGFVRFVTFEEAKRAANALNGAWVLEHRIEVNVARFGKASNGNSVMHEVHHYQNQSKKEVNQLRLYEQVASEGTRNQRKTFEGEKHGELHKEKMEKKEVVWCKGVVNAENLHWLERSVVGSIKEGVEMDKVEDLVIKDGFNGVKVRKFSAVECLISVEDESLFDRMKKENWRTFDKWFDNIVHWSENLHITCRPVWVACYGIPIHAWDLKTFQNIAANWGDFIRMDCVSLQMNSFSKGCMQIMSSIETRIDEVIKLQVGDDMFNIRVVELNHDCEFTGPCCYEELNLALKRSGWHKNGGYESNEEDECQMRDEGAESNEYELAEDDENAEAEPINEVNERLIGVGNINSTVGMETVNVESPHGSNIRVEELNEGGGRSNKSGNMIGHDNNGLFSSDLGEDVAKGRSISGRGPTSCNLNVIEGTKVMEASDGRKREEGPTGFRHESDDSQDMETGRGEKDIVNLGSNLEINQSPLGSAIILKGNVNILAHGPFENRGLAVLNSDVGEEKDSAVEEDSSEELVGQGGRFYKRWRHLCDVQEELITKGRKMGKKGKSKYKRKVNYVKANSNCSYFANQSVSDGDFQKRFEGICRDDEAKDINEEAEAIWNFGKQLGFEAQGNEDEVLYRLRNKLVKRKN
ncbi:hypothetical protein REPUB_Repub05bG0108400 [Reevesia pubescens]